MIEVIAFIALLALVCLVTYFFHILVCAATEQFTDELEDKDSYTLNVYDQTGQVIYCAKCISKEDALQMAEKFVTTIRGSKFTIE